MSKLEEKALKGYTENRERQKASNYSTILADNSMYNEYLTGKKSKQLQAHSKSKQVIEKINERARRMSDKKNPNLKFV